MACVVELVYILKNLADRGRYTVEHLGQGGEPIVCDNEYRGERTIVDEPKAGVEAKGPGFRGSTSPHHRTEMQAGQSPGSVQVAAILVGQKARLTGLRRPKASSALAS